MCELSPDKEGSKKPNDAVVKPEEDGRNIEWEDRARVNLEQVPENTTTNIERDFEPENLPKSPKDGPDEHPAY